MRDCSTSIKRIFNMLFLVCAVAILAGCGAGAAPCRVASAGIKIIPLVGGALAAPTDGCAEVIDP